VLFVEASSCTVLGSWCTC